MTPTTPPTTITPRTEAHQLPRSCCCLAARTVRVCGDSGPRSRKWPPCRRIITEGVTWQRPSRRAPVDRLRSPSPCPRPPTIAVSTIKHRWRLHSAVFRSRDRSYLYRGFIHPSRPPSSAPPVSGKLVYYRWVLSESFAEETIPLVISVKLTRIHSARVLSHGWAWDSDECAYENFIKQRLGSLS